MSDQPGTIHTSPSGPSPDDTATPPPTLGRRTVLRAAGVTGAAVAGAGVLAACGGSTTPTTGSDGASSTSATSAASGSSTSGSASSSASGAAPSGTPVKTADVPVGGGVVNAEALFVVTQPSAGQFKAFSATCTHKGCTVTKVVDGMIDCPCHDSQFDITSGTPTAGSQAKKALPAKTATVRGDSVYIA